MLIIILNRENLRFRSLLSYNGYVCASRSSLNKEFIRIDTVQKCNRNLKVNR